MAEVGYVPGTVLRFVIKCYYRRIEASSSSTDPVDDKLEPLEAEVCGSINRTSAEQLNSYRDIGTYVLHDTIQLSAALSPYTPIIDLHIQRTRAAQCSAASHRYMMVTRHSCRL